MFQSLECSLGRRSGGKGPPSSPKVRHKSDVSLTDGSTDTAPLPRTRAGVIFLPKHARHFQDQTIVRRSSEHSPRCITIYVPPRVGVILLPKHVRHFQNPMIGKAIARRFSEHSPRYVATRVPARAGLTLLLNHGHHLSKPMIVRAVVRRSNEPPRCVIHIPTLAVMIVILNHGILSRSQ